MTRNGDEYTYVDVSTSWALPRTFDWRTYIEVEEELWALFPETGGRRVTFMQIGLSSGIYAQVDDLGAPLAATETYVLMPCQDGRMRPLRMECLRRINHSEYRRAHLSAVKLLGQNTDISGVLQIVGRLILGEEVTNEIAERSK